MKSAALTRSNYRKLIAVAIFALMLAAPLTARAFTCPTVTTVGAAGNCGIVISAPGCYTLATGQVSTSDTSDCIQIASSKVVLLLPLALFGTGSTSTAAGIHVLATTPGGSADASVVMGGSPITNVTIIAPNANGQVLGFNVGVLSEANDVRIDGVTSNQNVGDGIRLNNVKANRVSGVTATSNGGSGLSIIGSSDNLVSDCNLSTDGNGVSLTNSNGNTIIGSTLGASFGAGAFLQTSNANKLGGNTANGNGNDGFQISGSSANTFSANTANSNGVGMSISNSPATEVSANTVQFNGTGIELSNDDSGSHLESNAVSFAEEAGIHVNAGSTALTITGNIAENNSAVDIEDDNPGCANNLWIGNTFITAAPPSCIH